MCKLPLKSCKNWFESSTPGTTMSVLGRNGKIWDSKGQEGLVISRIVRFRLSGTRQLNRFFLITT